MQEIRKVLGEIPILASEQKLLDDAGGEEEEAISPKAEVVGGGRPKVLADGTYATETAYSSTTAARLEAVRATSKPPLRSASLFWLSVTFSESGFNSTVAWRRLLYRCCPGDGPHETGSPIR